MDVSTISDAFDDGLTDVQTQLTRRYFCFWFFTCFQYKACRKFTPILKTIYEKLKWKQQQQQQATPTSSAQNDNDFVDDFEIVYCSSDNYSTEYNSYATQMPWWCLPHQSPLVDRLRTAYQAEGIPHLCVIDKNGELICGDAVSEVMEDTNGTNFPWRCPHSLEEILPDTYVDKEGDYHPTSELHNKYLLLYFGAQWCQRSAVFTEQLMQAHTTLKQKRNDFEVSCTTPMTFPKYGHISFLSLFSCHSRFYL